MRKKTLSGLLTVLLAAAFSYGCAGPVKVSYNPVSPVLEDEGGGRVRPVPILVKPFTDMRAGPAEGADPKRIGTINSTVSNIYSDRLTLSRTPAEIVTEGFKKELSTSGYTVISEGDDRAGPWVVLSGEIRRFSLDIGPRDEIDIEVYTELKEKGTERIIWSGISREKGSRYAGVMGDSRSKISKYISTALSKVIIKTIKESAPKIDKAYGPEGKEAAPVEEGPLYTGTLLINTDPSRTKVYLNGVYYGLTPLTIEINTGVYDLLLKKAGFMDFKERVAVGKGRTTEMEAALEKE